MLSSPPNKVIFNKSLCASNFNKQNEKMLPRKLLLRLTSSALAIVTCAQPHVFQQMSEPFPELDSNFGTSPGKEPITAAKEKKIHPLFAFYQERESYYRHQPKGLIATSPDFADDTDEYSDGEIDGEIDNAKTSVATSGKKEGKKEGKKWNIFEKLKSLFASSSSTRKSTKKCKKEKKSKESMSGVTSLLDVFAKKRSLGRKVKDFLMRFVPKSIKQEMEERTIAEGKRLAEQRYQKQKIDQKLLADKRFAEQQSLGGRNNHKQQIFTIENIQSPPFNEFQPEYPKFAIGYM